MPAVCSLCRHAEREGIDAAIVAGRDSLRNIALRYGTSAPSVMRHREHIPGALVLARKAEEVTAADSLLEKTRTLESDARRLLAKAEAEGDFRAAIAAVKTALDVVALLHKVAAEEETDLLAHPVWLRLRRKMADALAPFPDALHAVLEAIRSEQGDAR